MFKLLSKLLLAKKAWDVYTDYKRNKHNKQSSYPTRRNGFWD